MKKKIKFDKKAIKESECFKDTKPWINDKKFYPNEEYRIVTCVHDAEVEWNMDFDVNNHCPGWVFDFYNRLHHSSANPFFKTSNDIMSIAFCDYRDEFDFGKGKIIAAKKADWKVEDRMAREFDALGNVFIKLSGYMFKMADMHQDKANDLAKSLEKYYDEDDGE